MHVIFCIDDSSSVNSRPLEYGCKSSILSKLSKQFNRNMCYEEAIAERPLEKLQQKREKWQRLLSVYRIEHICIFDVSLVFCGIFGWNRAKSTTKGSSERESDSCCLHSQKSLLVSEPRRDADTHTHGVSVSAIWEITQRLSNNASESCQPYGIN